jgi:hypothetical protein
MWQRAKVFLRLRITFRHLADQICMKKVKKKARRKQISAKNLPQGKSRAVSYLDLWEKQVSHAALHMDLSDRKSG